MVHIKKIISHKDTACPGALTSIEVPRGKTARNLQPREYTRKVEAVDGKA